MRSHTLTTALAAVFAGAALTLAGGPAAKDAKEPAMPERAEKAKVKLDAELARLKAQQGQVVWISAPAVRQAFPKEDFFAVRFRQFPVARVMPEGLSASNVFVVPAGGKLHRIAGDGALSQHFRKHLAPVRDEKTGRRAVAAWLTLAQEFVQDGFFGFEILARETEVAKSERGLDASGRAMVTRGGNGELRVTLHFNGEGKVTDAKYEAKIRPGPRPICQATKLLDPDPIVRRMAEQDLLIMGRAARDYLSEQRTRANPELQRAIDRLWRRIQAEE